MQSESIFSGKKHIETITPARYSVGNPIKYDKSASQDFIPKHYFPDAEYPINILEASKPFYVVTGANNALITPFTDGVAKKLNSALSKPAKRKINSNNINKYSTPFTKQAKTSSAVAYTKNVTNITIPDTSSPNLIIQDQATSQQTKTADVKNITKSEKMTLREFTTKEYDEYEELYNTDYSIENSTVFDDLVEVFYSNEFNNDDYTVNELPEYDSILEDSINKNCNTQQNYTLENNEESVKPVSETSDTSPLKVCLLPSQKNQSETTKLNDVRKAPKKVGVVPLNKVKKRKFLKNMYTIPSKIFR